MVASTKTPNDEGGLSGVKLVIGALAVLSRHVLEQVFPDVFAQCEASQVYRFQILFSSQPSHRLHLKDPVSIESLPQKQGVYRLDNLGEWQLLRHAVGSADTQQVPASGEDHHDAAVRLHLETALRLVQHRGDAAH